ncbi:hypothetical protein [Pseudomonas citronellolis]|uniref:hypothetical protein n=1 Tax=Pseudomonas citronellolis TaxID=53408 RepID=UPI0023E4193F|nr:hypothetical protein [Pseudomonas citronellolis]MDF3936061.1 hypothetical protein [Pseudomonas citronellolis]
MMRDVIGNAESAAQEGYGGKNAFLRASFRSYLFQPGDFSVSQPGRAIFRTLY